MSTQPLPLPVRLHDMQELEDRYRAASPDERMALHLCLDYYELLADEERFALERRYPNELHGEPTAASATDGVRVAWDLRSRELIVCMLQYGEKALAAGMDLVRAVEPTQDVAIFAMTATGSFLELGRPMSDGSRRYIYRASARPGGRRDDGAVKLEHPVKLGNRVWLENRVRTSELLIVAAGAKLPPDDDKLPGIMLFGPSEDEPAVQPNDPLRFATTRFRVLVDAAENAPAGPLRGGLQQAAAEVAKKLQQLAGPDGGGPGLTQVRGFATGSGARYEVKRDAETVDLVRHDADGKSVTWFQDADIGDQTIVEGVPLVVFYRGSRDIRNVAFLFRVAQIEP